MFIFENKLGYELCSKRPPLASTHVSRLEHQWPTNIDNHLIQLHPGINETIQCL